ncbi:MAG TPA: PEP-CTERM sorting domain-containing protein [Edaphobacter sp.]|jgi:hypothetical protein|nr:PEP-CTERM sorting domain-containing protein [Edaphobacter sp.]
MRNSLLVLALALCVAAPVAAHADTFSYNFVLTQQSGTGMFGSDSGQAVGSGSFTVVSTTPTPGNTDFKAIDQNNKTPSNYVSALDFLIDGFDFDLLDASSNPGDPTHGVNSTQIQFNNGALSQILYTGTQVVGGVTIGINGNGGLTYAFRDGNTTSNGFITATPATATPEPSALILFGTGALGLAGLARRKFFV